jgi:signal peptidase II
MNWKKISLLLLLLLIADQALKIWIKTHLSINEAIMVFPDWFQLRFIENNGAAFGMQIAKSGAVDWGKIALSLFRIGLCGFMGWFINRLIQMKAPTGAIVGLVLVLAGAIGNILDSAFYGLIFSASTPTTVAEFGGSYAPFLMGKVVDMFYFPLFHWEHCPAWLDFLVDSRGYFFGAIFNLADVYISVAAIYLLLFQFRFFNKNF